jgi:hypothetical protein
MNIITNIKFSCLQLVTVMTLSGILLSSANSCVEDVDYTVENEGTIYMAQALESKSYLQLFDIDTIQDIFFGASYGGIKYPDNDINVKFTVDESLINAYNQEHGTNYIAFPQASYNISGLESVIKAGTANSDPIKVMITARQLQIGKSYMLPVKLVSAGSSNIKDDLNTAYFRIDSLIRRERDITNLGAFSVSHENNGGPGAGEGSPKLVDNNLGTKYLTQGYAPGMWFQVKYNTPQVIGAYTFTSGNDASERDPKTWRFEASNDGNTWTVLDNKVEYFFSDRNQTKRFETTNTTPYTYYRVTVVSNNGSNLFQMTEWRLIQYY